MELLRLCDVTQDNMHIAMGILHVQGVASSPSDDHRPIAGVVRPNGRSLVFPVFLVTPAQKTGYLF